MKRDRGFTLLELLVATAVMGIAVVGLLSSISSSLNLASRLTARDRSVLLARKKMGELLVDYKLPQGAPLEGMFEPIETGGVETGWRARLTPFEAPPEAQPGNDIIERIELQIWWATPNGPRTFSLEGFRRGKMGGPEAPPR